MAIFRNDTLNGYLCITSFVEFPVYSYDPGNCWVNVKLSAPKSADHTQQRPPLDLVAVIDRSRSMRGEKFSLVKNSLRFLISQLNCRDRLSLVVYDQKVETIFPLTLVTPQVKDSLGIKIESIGIGKGTNLCEGLIRGIKTLQERRNTDAVASLLLFSDGLATCGIISVEKVVAAMKNPYNEFAWQRKKQQYTVNTFGIGINHNTSMLEAISRTGMGVFYYSSCLKEIRNQFANCIGGLMSTFAQDISVNINSLKGAKICEAKDFELSMGYTFAIKDIPDIQCEEELDLLFELSLPQQQETDENSNNYAKLQVSYTNSLLKRRELTQLDIFINRVRDLKFPPQTNSEVDIQRNRWRAIHAMRDAKERANRDVREARDILNECKSEITQSKTHDGIQSKWILEDLDRILEGMKDRNSFIESGNPLLTASLHSHTRQRSITYTTGEYMTTMRSETLNESARFTGSKNSVN